MSSNTKGHLLIKYVPSDETTKAFAVELNVDELDICLGAETLFLVEYASLAEEFKIGRRPILLKLTAGGYLLKNEFS